MVLAKSKKKAGLGNTLMNDRFGKGKGSDRKKSTAVTRINHATGEEYLVNDKQDAAWVKMRSVTEQGALDEFLATAELAGTDFTAEKTNNVKIIHTDQRNPYLLSAHEERVMLGKQKANKGRLTVPRRPQWDSSTTPAQLDRAEREAFLGWRRGLAELQENNDLLMTPFERNIEVWRQLWRVIERSDLVVQIVDARNPLLFRSADLEDYVKAVDSSKENLLLINKSDMMTKKQRRAWAKHLREAGIAYKFFSAHLAKERNEALEKGLESEDEPVVIPSSSKKAGKQRVPQDEESSEEDSEDSEDSEESDEEDGGARTVSSDEEDIQILTVEELEDIFLKYAPNTSDSDHKLQVGLVGYPNVGKSSTINALIGSKKVSVSATPGKTKHFQTIHLSERVLLCDCPGLVFPNFASTKADLVCNGILPIDQMRESAGPVGLLTRRIPKRFLEATYGIHIKTRPIEEGGTGEPTAEEFLRAYAQARGYQTQGLGQPDISRAARYVLKDYVNGKLLYVAPPPGVDDGAAFNRELYDEYHLPAKRRAALVAAAETLTIDDPTPDPSTASVADPVDDDISVFSSDLIALPAGPKSKKLDGAFFGPGSGKQGHLTMPFNHKYTEQGAVDPEANRLLSGRKQRTMIALEHGMDPKDVQVVSGKKHFKGNGKAGKGRRRGVRHDLDD